MARDFSRWAVEMEMEGGGERGEGAGSAWIATLTAGGEQALSDTKDPNSF
ncbi:hypothetical protein PPACK8108_LOCUS13949 [Phakopsora pachyrhizi]|uniref:Uncharacterized protein n=1 Tax=Phakopsora pachyrhizi TaxID=170000 RepID=A0AAV0B6E7_PHAPC|nr:hypothetical protein PPACK8108_LOCUS13949 [Phakopsora pachyrhizi]